jgi:hypothetical protein
MAYYIKLLLGGAKRKQPLPGAFQRPATAV